MELKPDGSPMKVVTEEEYRKDTEWQEAPEEEVRGIVKNYQR